MKLPVLITAITLLSSTALVAQGWESVYKAKVKRSLIRFTDSNKKVNVFTAYGLVSQKKHEPVMPGGNFKCEVYDQNKVKKNFKVYKKKGSYVYLRCKHGLQLHVKSIPSMKNVMDAWHAKIVAKEKRAIVDVADLTYDLYLPWSHGVIPTKTIKLKKGDIFRARVENSWRARKTIKGYPASQLTKDKVLRFIYKGKGKVAAPPPKLIKKMPTRIYHPIPKPKYYRTHKRK